MDKQEVVKLARELFKIRISSSNEGHTQDDGIHQMEIGDVTSYNPKVIKQWFHEAIQISEIVISIEQEYLNKAD